MKIDENWDPLFAFQEVVRKQVEKEDTASWADTKIDNDEKAMRKLLPSTKKLGHAFPLQVLKFFQP